MSVEDIDRRLDDRFALLRGGDRSAPDRHQTLVAVIDWSWNLLTRGRAAGAAVARRSSTTASRLAGADALLGHDALDLVQSLVDQSLLTVIDARRDGPLPDARDGPRVRPDAAGRRRRGRRCGDGAPGLGPRATPRRTPPSSGRRGQVAAVRAIAVEENNLADALRAAVAVPDPAATAELTAALAGFWTMRGREHPGDRDDRGGRRRAGGLGAGAGRDRRRGHRRRRHGPQHDGRRDRRTHRLPGPPREVRRPDDRARAPRDWSPSWPRRTWTTRPARWSGCARSTSRTATTAQSVAMARLWSAHYLENDGDPERALEEATRGLALVDDADGPWIRAMMHSVAGGLNAQLGKRAEAAEHARQAIPILDQLEANDDAIQARSLLAGHAIAEGRFDEAERLIAEIERLSHDRTGLRRRLRHRHGPRRAGAGPGRRRRGAAALPRRRQGARRHQAAGHGAHRPGAVGAVRRGRRRHGVRPARHRRGAARTSSRRCAPRRRQVLERGPAPDGLPGRRHGAARARHLGAARSRRWTPRTPSGSWSSPSCSPTRGSRRPWTPTRTDDEAERVAPGLAARLRAEYGARKGPDLLPEARAVAERIAGLEESYILRL